MTILLFWIGVLAITILLYVLLDGFDLGVGILFGLTRVEERRVAMMDAIAPVWDGNETWLVLTGATLFGAFPLAYSILLSAFYLPVIAMLVALILRGIAFEFRYKTLRMRWVWDVGFSVGSLVAAFMQGLMVGALVEGLPISNGQYAGGDFTWLSPFALLCGVGLVLGYSLSGAAWLVGKCGTDVRNASYRQLQWLLPICSAVLAVVFVLALAEHLQLMNRWLQRPVLFVFPAVAGLAAIFLFVGVRRRQDAWLFRLAALLFISAFGTLAVSFWPYMIPFSVTVVQAASPSSSLSFMFWGAGIFVFPLTLLYALLNYQVFSGRSAHPTAYAERAAQRDVDRL
jgi:cytochrome d ubiquinol oxidase subunit II